MWANVYQYDKMECWIYDENTKTFGNKTDLTPDDNRETFTGSKTFVDVWSGNDLVFICNVSIDPSDNVDLIPMSTVTASITKGSSWKNLPGTVNYKVVATQYFPAPSQLTADAEYVYNASFMGKNGVEQGLLGLDLSSKFNDPSAELYGIIQSTYDAMTPIPIVGAENTSGWMQAHFPNIRIVPTKSDGTPLFDTSGLTRMLNLFQNCKQLVSVPALDTSGVTNHSLDMYDMFNGCSKLKHVGLMDTSTMVNMNGMFEDCVSLETIPQFNTSQVQVMTELFRNCTSLKSIPNLDTSSATSMRYMFYKCVSLTSVPAMNSVNVTDFSYIFSYCSSLKTVGTLNLNKGTTYSNMFSYCTALEEIDLSGGTINSSASHGNMFRNVPTNCTIYVQSQTEVDLLTSWDSTHTYTIKT
jgi:surface protein